MLPPVCVTCGFLLADKQLLYEKQYELINNENTTEDKKMVKVSNLLHDLGVKKYCCRSRVISYVDQAKLII